MFYYKLDIIPIILSNFKVNDIVICGLSDKKTINQIVKYCDDSNAAYIAIDSKDFFKKDNINDSTLNVLPNFNNYDSIFIDDDPNWYTIYNELNIIKQNNDDFPLVFICNNIFPHKRRDSYINPNIIPEEFQNEFSDKLIYNDIFIDDGFYHANEYNTPKNGVLTAIEDFLSKNPSIGIMDIKLLNGITILYPKNNISYFRLNKLNEEIENYCFDYDDFDNFVKNQMLTDYISKLHISKDSIDVIDELKKELDEKEKIINSFEEKIKLHNNELSFKDSQINRFNSKLSLRESQIKNVESKLVNHVNEINNINDELKSASNQIDSLKNDVSKKELYESELMENIRVLNMKIEEKSQMLDDKDNVILNKEDQIRIKQKELDDKDNVILNKENQIRIKQKELVDKDLELNYIKNQVTNQSSKLDNSKYCISCFKEEINNNHSEIDFLKKNTLTRKIFSPFSYIYLLLKSDPKEFSLNFKLYKALKNSACFDIGYYLSNNEDIKYSKWCKYFSPELHYVCRGFKENRKFNKKYFDRNSKRDLLNYIMNCQ